MKLQSSKVLGDCLVSTGVLALVQVSYFFLFVGSLGHPLNWGLNRIVLGTGADSRLP